MFAILPLVHSEWLWTGDTVMVMNWWLISQTHLHIRHLCLHLAIYPTYLNDFHAWKIFGCYFCARLDLHPFPLSMLYSLVFTRHIALSHNSVFCITLRIVSLSLRLTVLQKANKPRVVPSHTVSTMGSMRDSAGSLQTARTEDVFFDAVSKLDTNSLLSRQSLRSLQSIGRASSPRRRQRRRRGWWLFQWILWFTCVS